MLGKASEIKTQHVYDRDNGFENQMHLWEKAHPTAIIIEIKITSNFDAADNHTQVHALIIYKEGESNGTSQTP